MIEMKATALLLCGLSLAQPLFSEESSTPAALTNVQCTVESYGIPLIQGVATGRMLCISIEGAAENTLLRNDKDQDHPVILRQGEYSFSIESAKLDWNNVTKRYIAIIEIPEEWATTQPYSIELPLIHAPEGSETIITALEKNEKESIITENYILHYGEGIHHGSSDQIDYMVRYKEINPLLKLEVLKKGKIVEAYFSRNDEIYGESEHYSEEEIKNLPLSESGYLSIYSSYEEEEDDDDAEEEDKKDKEEKPETEVKITLLKGAPSWKTVSIEIPAVTGTEATTSSTSTQKGRPTIAVTGVLERASLSSEEVNSSFGNDSTAQFKLLFSLQNIREGIYAPTEHSRVDFTEKSEDYDYITSKSLSYFVWDPQTGTTSFSTSYFNASKNALQVNQRIELNYCADGLVKARVASGDKSGVWKHGPFELPYTLTRTPNSVNYSFKSENDTTPYFQLRFLDTEGNVLFADIEKTEMDQKGKANFDCTLAETAASVEFYYMPTKPTKTKLQLKIPKKK